MFILCFELLNVMCSGFSGGMFCPLLASAATSPLLGPRRELPVGARVSHTWPVHTPGAVPTLGSYLVCSIGEKK